MGLLAGTSLLSIIEIFYHILKQNSQKLQNEISPGVQPQVEFEYDDHALFQLSRYFVEFFRDSSMHGLHYIGDRNQNRFGRIFWMLLLATSTIICLFFTVVLHKNEGKSQITVRIDPQTWTLDDVRKFSWHFCMFFIKTIPDSISIGNDLSRLEV